MKVDRAVTIERSPEAVYRFATDPHTWPEWSSTFERVDVPFDGAPAKGSAFHTHARVAGQRVEFSFEVNEAEEPTRFRFRSISGPVKTRFSWSFAVSGSGTRMTFGMEGDLPGPMKLAAPAASAAFDGQVRADLERLKALLEAREETSPA